MSVAISYVGLNISSVWHNSNDIPISIQWRHRKVITSGITGNSTVCHGCLFPDELADPHETQFPSIGVPAQMITERPHYVCNNYSPGSIKGMTDETSNARHFELNQYRRKVFIQILHLRGISVHLICVIHIIFWTSTEIDRCNIVKTGNESVPCGWGLFL